MLAYMSLLLLFYLYCTGFLLNIEAILLYIYFFIIYIMYVYKIVNNLAPQCLSNLLYLYTPFLFPFSGLL